MKWYWDSMKYKSWIIETFNSRKHAICNLSTPIQICKLINIVGINWKLSFRDFSLIKIIFPVLLLNNLPFRSFINVLSIQVLNYLPFRSFINVLSISMYRCTIINFLHAVSLISIIDNWRLKSSRKLKTIFKLAAHQHIRYLSN